MEKIYMEEYRKRDSKSTVSNFSIVLSFTVAAFAIFSLAFLGNGISKKN